MATGTGMSFSAIRVLSLLPDMSLTFWCRLDGIALAVCIYGRPNSTSKTAGIIITTKGISNLHGPTSTFMHVRIGHKSEVGIGEMYMTVDI